MKKVIVLVGLLVVTCLIGYSLIMSFNYRNLKNRLNTTIVTKMDLNNDNVISVVDTIYGRKYVVAVDTVTGRAEILGPRHNPVMIEDY